MTHTKGPWAINGSTYTGYLEAENIMSGDGREILYAAYDGTFIIESIDDAHLIAAAPELLEALQQLLQVQDGLPMNGIEATRRSDLARAAIAKAEGKA